MVLQIMSASSQIITIITVTLASLSSGLMFTWPTQAIPTLIQDKTISLEEGSYFSVFAPAALVIASPLFATLVDKIGRKNTLIITVLLQLASWGCTIYGGSIMVYYIARIINGVADAGYYTVVPVFIAEIATPKIRGTWGNSMTFNVYVGNLLGVVLVYLCGIRESACVFCVFPLVLLAGLYWIPESPYFLLMKKRDESAKKALKFYRKLEDVDGEFHEISVVVNRQLSESGSVRDLFVIGSNRRGLGIVGFLRCATQFGGISAFSVYAPFIFAESTGEVSDINSTVIFTSLLVITNFGAAIVLDFVGRRRAMIISCAGCGIILAAEATYFYLKMEIGVNLEIVKLFPIIGMSLYVVFYSIGMGILPSLMMGELFSSSVKGKCVCVMNIVYGLCLGASTKIFQVFMSNFGLYMAFGFFSGCCLVSTVVSILIVPEIKGKTLEEIQQTLKTSK